MSEESSKEQKETPKAPVKPPRFGGIELGIFIGLWIIMIIAFKIYTRRKARKQQHWFGPNEEKEEYIRLLNESDDNEDLLKRALVRRCITDVRRLISLQDERDSVMSLGRSGALSEELLNSYKAAEKELELEMFEVQAEAETFKKGWGEEIIKDSVRIMRIEDEVMEVKKRKEKEERRKAAAEGAEADGVVDEGRKVEKPLSQEEKLKLLMELMAEEQLEKMKKSSEAGSKVVKRKGSKN